LPCVCAAAPSQVRSGNGLQNVQAFQGIPAALVAEMVEPLRCGVAPTFHTLGAEFEFVSLGQVRGMGALGDAEAQALEATCPAWPPRLLAVKRRWGGYPAIGQLMDGDVVLTMGGANVRTFRDVELACAPPVDVAVAAPAPAEAFPAAAAAAAVAAVSAAKAAAAAAAAPVGSAAVGVKVWATPLAEARALKDTAAQAAPEAAAANVAACPAACAAMRAAAASASLLASGSSAGPAPGSGSGPSPPPNAVRVEVLRAGKRVVVDVPTKGLGSDKTTRVLRWGGGRAPGPARRRGAPAGPRSQRGLRSQP